MASREDDELLDRLEKMYGNEAKQYLEKNTPALNKVKTTLKESLSELDLNNLSADAFKDIARKLHLDLMTVLEEGVKAGILEKVEVKADNLRGLGQMAKNNSLEETPTSQSPFNTRPDPFKR